MSDAIDAISPALERWLEGVTLDSANGRLNCPSMEFAHAQVLREFFLPFAPDLWGAVTSLDLLLAMLRYLISATSADHPLSGEFYGLVSHYEFEARIRTRQGLRGIAEGRYEPISRDAPFVLPVILCEILRAFIHLMKVHGFTDVQDGGTKKVVIVHGRYRTGSTRVFSAVRAILELAGESYSVVGADFGDVDKYIRCFEYGAYSGKWLLIKTHNWLPASKTCAVVPIYTQRHLADVAASGHALWRRTGNDEDVSNLNYASNNDSLIISEVGFQKFLNDYVMPMVPTEIVRYEEYYQNEPALVQRLLGVLGVPLDEEAVRVAAKLIEPELVKKKTDSMGPDEEDLQSLLRSKHISDSLGKPRGQLNVLSNAVRTYLMAIREWPL